MSSISPPPLDGSAAFLRRFVKRRPAAERCELCGREVPPSHQHLLEINARRLLCACDACSILFSGQAATKFRRVPRRNLSLQNFELSDAQWEALSIPINMAFFVFSTPSQRMDVMYPSPAGATEALVAQDVWSEIVAVNPVLTTLEPDVEALLVNRAGRGREGGEAEYFVVPIDECFKLVGVIRLHWKGLSGGTEVWQEIAQFFVNLKQKSRISGGAHA
ncbi:MAG TPA: DUF5947 family protein [Candidatus Acidoferrum sp.]|jgi:hypothetical protein